VLPSLPLARQANALLVSYTPGNGAGERNRTVVLALARPHSAVEPHPQNGVPSRILTSNLTLRTRPLCDLSYGDLSKSELLAGLFHRLNHPAMRDRWSYFAFRNCKMVRASGNAPEPGTDLVRCGV
jgi:hypothetical protein